MIAKLSYGVNPHGKLVRAASSVRTNATIAEGRTVIEQTSTVRPNPKACLWREVDTAQRSEMPREAHTRTGLRKVSYAPRPAPSPHIPFTQESAPAAGYTP